jgi:phage virion morphogenesis protein
MTIIRIDVRSEEASRLLDEMQRRTGDLNPVLKGIGDILVSSTQQRFVDQKGPDGNPWAALSPVTLARRRGGGIGANILRDTGRLASSVNYKVSGGSIDLGTNVIYAGTHQYGARKGAYGKTKRNSPIPWGDIPARPMFGYSDQDQQDVLELIERYLNASQPPSWWQRFLARFRRIFG